MSKQINKRIIIMSSSEWKKHSEKYNCDMSYIDYVERIKFILRKFDERQK